ncbi:DUF3829 domain-containing protein [Brucellaceae bacterium C25G]
MNKLSGIVILGAAGIVVGAYATGQLNPWLPQEMKVGISSASLLGSGEVVLPTRDNQLESKLQPVISCLNNVSNSLRNHAQTYADEYPRLIGTPGATRQATSFKIKVYEQNNAISRECINGLRNAVSMPPEDADLDTFSKDFADTLEQLIPLMNELDVYYSRKDNIDDNMKKGKELTEQLTPLFAKLFDADDRLHDIVSTRNNMLRENRLLAIEQAFGTENFGWQTFNVSLAARKAIDNVYKLAEDEQMSAQSIEKIEQEYQAALDKADTFANAHPDTKTKLGNTPKWFALSSNFNTILADIKDLRRLLASNSDEQSVNHQLKKLQNDYNSMIRNYNMIPDV